MTSHPLPEMSPELFERIRLVRRDMGDMLFHFTRKPDEDCVKVEGPYGTMTRPTSASAVLDKILHEGKLRGGSHWTYGENCVCFTEAPIHEFNAIFSLVRIASSRQERPRYEPYGIAVSKTWLFAQGGRPVIYDHPEAFDSFPPDLKYRFVPYDPPARIDYTWEREWRIKTDTLTLDPSHTLAVVPTAGEAFSIVYGFNEEEPDWDYADGESYIAGIYHEPRWLAVSLDLFGFSQKEK